MVMLSRKAMMSTDRAARYIDVVNSLSATPIAYWPLNETSGTTINDLSGNARGGTSSGVTVAQAGQLGNAYQFAGSGVITAGAALTAAINPRECAVSMIINVNRNDSLVPRLHVIYTDALSNYNVPEVRVGNRLDMYLQEDGQTGAKVEFWILPDEEWVHLVFFNSESQGQFGAYVNGLYMPVGRTVPGLPVGEDIITTNYPQLGTQLTGYLQHVVWLDIGIPTQADVDALYYGAFPQPSTEIVNVLTDTFDGSEAAPITSPRASGLVVTDSGNLMSVSSGSLIWSGKTADVTTPRIMTSSALDRVVGRAVVTKITPGSTIAGWRLTNTASPNTLGILFQSGTLFGYLNTALPNLGSATTNGTVEYSLAFVMGLYGGDVFIKGGAFTEWTFILTMDTLIDAWYGGFGVGSASTNNAITSFRVSDLPAPFNKWYEFATDRLAGGVTTGTSFTHEANCVISYSLTTRPTSGGNDFRFRIQDASNYWQVVITSTGAITLNEVVAGTPTQRATAASGLANGSKIWLYMSGSRIQAIASQSGAYSSPWTYSSASNFATETDGQVTSVGTGGRISDVVVYPRTLSGDAVTVLNAAVA